MNTDTTEQFYFQVALTDCVIAFQEVSGLVEETQVIEYKTGNSPFFLRLKCLGSGNTEILLLKKGWL